MEKLKGLNKLITLDPLTPIKPEDRKTILLCRDFISTDPKGIDVFLTVNPKGCGILNRVLDAIAFEVPIVGIKASFSGFQDSAGIYTEFHDYNSFVDAMDFVSNHYEECILKAKQAVEYAKMHNDWENNYNKLVDNIIC